MTGMRGGMMNRRTRRFAASTRIFHDGDSAHEKYAPLFCESAYFLHTRQRRDDERLRSAERPYLEQSLRVIPAGGGVD
jgi:hypothetical protein